MSTLSKKKKDGRTTRELTVKQKLAAKYMIEKGGTAADALRAAKYSPAIINNPAKVTRSKGFAALLDKAGVTDTFLAKKHRTLLNSTRLEEKNFEALKVGRKWRHVSNEFIKLSIEGTDEDPTGCKVIHIGQGSGYKRAIFRHPDAVVQAKAMDLAYKTKGHLAAEKIDLTVDHELSEEEKAALAAMFSK